MVTVFAIGIRFPEIEEDDAWEQVEKIEDLLSEKGVSPKTWSWVVWFDGDWLYVLMKSGLDARAVLLDMKRARPKNLIDLEPRLRKQSNTWLFPEPERGKQPSKAAKDWILEALAESASFQVERAEEEVVSIIASPGLGSRGRARSSVDSSEKISEEELEEIASKSGFRIVD